MADGYFTMSSVLESGEEKLLTKLLCFFRTGDFMANSPRIRVDLIVVSSLESTRTRYCRLRSDEAQSGFVQADVTLNNVTINQMVHLG